MSKKQSSTPHDALFKLFLRQPDTARDFLAFHLPAPIHALCDMKTLKLESSSFIDDDLRESYSDVLWSVKTEQGPGYIYCLIEHQSTSNKLIAFRMMRYAIAAMQNHLDAGYKTLPMVVPLLFYHGIESPYPYSLCWLDCFADPNLARQLYASAFPLIDVTVMPDDEIMQHRRMALLELIQKHIRQRDLMGLVEQMACLLSSGYANDRQIKGLFNYILQTGDAVRFNDFIDDVAKPFTETQGEFNDYCGKIAAGGTSSRGTTRCTARCTARTTPGSPGYCPNDAESGYPPRRHNLIYQPDDGGA